MARVSLGGDNGSYKFEPVEVDLWGKVFHTKPVTRSVKKALGELTERLVECEDEDEQAGIYADMVAAMTVPTNGARKTAGQIIREKWEKDELSDEELTAFANELREAMTRPPTPSPSS